VEARVDRVGRDLLVGGRLLAKRPEAPVRPGLDESVLTWVRHRLQIDRRARAARLVQAPHLRQIGVGEDVAVQDEQSPRDQVGGIADTAASPERLLLDDVPETDAEVLAVTE